MQVDDNSSHIALPDPIGNAGGVGVGEEAMLVKQCGL
jgi:hypothetical protein